MEKGRIIRSSRRTPWDESCKSDGTRLAENQIVRHLHLTVARSLGGHSPAVPNPGPLIA